MAAIRKHQPSFYHLYTHAYKGSPILEAVAYSSSTQPHEIIDRETFSNIVRATEYVPSNTEREIPSIIHKPRSVNADYLRRKEHVLRSVLGKAMSESEGFMRSENSDGKTTYSTTMAYYWR